MKNLVLPTLIAALASQAAGCFFGGNSNSNLGNIQVSWALKSTDAAGNPIAAGCPAGATTATLFALPTGAPPSSAFQDKYDCVDGGGLIGDLDPGLYTVWVRLTDTSGATRFAESGSQDIQVNAGGTQSAPYDIFVDRGFLMVGWNLTGRGTSCAAVANHGVGILATDGGGSARGFDTKVDCTEGEGRKTITDPIPSVGSGLPGVIGTYTVVVSLLNNLDQSIGDAPTQNNKTIDYGNEYEDLGILQINVR